MICSYLGSYHFSTDSKLHYWAIHLFQNYYYRQSWTYDD